jgi:hypothetical protein
MAFLAGGSIAIDLRLLGFVPFMPIKPLRGFMPLFWLAFAVIAATGSLLLIAYPTKALTNPLFYFKLCLIAVAFWLVYRLGTGVLRSSELDPKAVPPNAKLFAIVSLAVWLTLIGAGRFLAYTHKWELFGVPAVL